MEIQSINNLQQPSSVIYTCPPWSTEVDVKITNSTDKKRLFILSGPGQPYLGRVVLLPGQSCEIKTYLDPYDKDPEQCISIESIPEDLNGGISVGMYFDLRETNNLFVEFRDDKAAKDFVVEGNHGIFYV